MLSLIGLLFSFEIKIKGKKKLKGSQCQHTHLQIRLSKARRSTPKIFDLRNPS